MFSRQRKIESFHVVWEFKQLQRRRQERRLVMKRFIFNNLGIIWICSVYNGNMDEVESNSVSNRTSDLQIGTTVKRESDLLILSMITDRIGRHEVLLTINHAWSITHAYHA